MRESIFNFIKKFYKKHFRIAVITILTVIFGIYLITYSLATRLHTAYNAIKSPIIKDRNEKIINIQQNERGYYSRKVENVSQEFKKLLIKKEDRFFYWHLGINPFSILRDATSYMTTGKLEGSSTLTQYVSYIEKRLNGASRLVKQNDKVINISRFRTCIAS